MSLHFGDLIHAVHDVGLDVQLEARVGQAMVDEIMKLLPDSVDAEVVAEDAQIL